MRIDFHIHLGRCDPFYYSREKEEQLSKSTKDLIDEMKKHRVDKAIVIPNYRLSHRLIRENFELASAIKAYTNIMIGFAWLDPRISDSPKQLEILVKRHNFRGLKLHPVLNGYYLTNEVVHPLIEKSIELGIPVLIHTGWGPLGNVNYVGKLAEKYPKAILIIAHMIEPECVNVAKRYKNVFLETSYARHPRAIEQAVQVLGAEKLLYGSDYPMGGGMEFEMLRITLARIKEEQKELILGGNAQRILKI